MLDMLKLAFAMLGKDKIADQVGKKMLPAIKG